jgi:HK97 family phage major capsid protein
MPNFNENIVEFLNNSSSNFTSTVDVQRKAALVEAMESTKGDFIRSIDLMLIHDEELRNEFNYEARKQGKSGVAYPILARGLFEAGKIDEKTFQRAAGVLDTVTNPGGANFLQTTVANFVAETIDEIGLVAKEVQKFDLKGEGNLQIPTFNPKLKSAFAANTANYTDLGSTIEGGTGSITLNAQKVGAYTQLRPDFMNKLGAGRLQFILKQLAEAQARAYDDVILNGTGSSPIPTGMNQNALTGGTDFAVGSDIFDTLLNAIEAISDRRAGRTSDIRIFMNTSAKQEFVKLERLLSNNRTNILQSSKGGLTIADYPVIITDVILNTNATAPANKTSLVTVGYANQYYWGNSKAPQVVSDSSVGFLSETETLRVSGMADGKPAFNNAFAKFTVTTGVEGTL